jgi:type VI protein secretion system component Hcp
MDEKEKKPEEITGVPSPELAEPQLDKVVGGSGAEAGKINVSEITIKNIMDQASPSLFQQATGGSGTTTTTTTDTVVPRS